MSRSSTVVMALLIVGCSTGPAAPSGPPSASPGEPTSPVSAPSQRLTGAPSRAPTGSASSSVSDPPGDVADPDGNPPPAGGPAADLTSVSIQRGADRLTVRFEVSGPVPPTADSLLWSVDLDGQRRYTLAAQLTGGELNAGVYDHRRDVQHALGRVEVDGAVITVHVPGDELEELGAAFEWSALTQLDGAYEDRTATATFQGSSE